MRQIRPLVKPLLFVSLVGLAACSRDKDAGGAAVKPEATPAKLAAVEAKAGARVKLESIQPRIGGSLVAVGDYSAEIRLYAHGAAEGLVLDPSGALLTEPKAARLSLTANARGGGRPQIALVWDASRSRFVGQAEGDVMLAPAPIDVSLTIAGKTATGSLVRYGLLAAPELGGSLVVVGDRSAEILVAADGEVAAMMHDTAGVRITGDLGVDVSAALNAQGGAEQKLKLAWDPARLAFVGRAAAGVELAPGPFELSVSGSGGIATGRLDLIALRGLASHGGVVICAGSFSAELVAGADGVVAAYVMDATGRAYAKGDLDVQLALDLRTNKTIRLSWDAPSASYRAKVDADLRAAVRPIALSINAGGKASVGMIASLRASADAKVAAQAEADLGANASGRALAGVGAGAKASLNVQPPRVSATAKAGVNNALGAKASLNVKPPSVKVEAKRAATASAKAGTSSKSGLGGKLKAGFNLGTK